MKALVSVMILVVLIFLAAAVLAGRGDSRGVLWDEVYVLDVPDFSVPVEDLIQLPAFPGAEKVTIIIWNNGGSCEVGFCNQSILVSRVEPFCTVGLEVGDHSMLFDNRAVIFDDGEDTCGDGNRVLIEYGHNELSRVFKNGFDGPMDIPVIWQMANRAWVNNADIEVRETTRTNAYVRIIVEGRGALLSGWQPGRSNKVATDPVLISSFADDAILDN